jgi:hypothetical protein
MSSTSPQRTIAAPHVAPTNPGTTILRSPLASGSTGGAPAVTEPIRSIPVPWILGSALGIFVLVGAVAIYFAFSKAPKKAAADSTSIASHMANSTPGLASTDTGAPFKSSWCVPNAIDCVKVDVPDPQHADVEVLIQKALTYGRKKRPYGALFGISADGMTDDGIDLTVMAAGVEVRFQDTEVSISHDAMSLIERTNLPPAPPPHCTLSESYKRARAYGLPADRASARASNEEVVFISGGATPTTVKLSGTTCQPYRKMP